MALQGNLRDFSVTEILQLLGTQKKTGCLLLEADSRQALFYVQEGRVVATRRPGLEKDDPLLRFLLRVHRLSSEQYGGILTIQRESSRDLEDLLVNGRYLDAEELAIYIERQILDDLARVLEWENGSYRFDPHERWPNPPLARLSVEAALIEASRRIDEQRRFAKLLADPLQLIGVRDLPDADEHLSEEECELFGIIDGRHTLAEITAAAPLSDYEAHEALQRMLEAGWIEVVGRREPGAAAEPAAETAARAAANARPAPPRHVQLKELAVGALALAVTVGLAFGVRFLETRGGTPSQDVYLASRVRDVRFALEIYRRDRGQYPERLEKLVADGWMSSERLRVRGRTLRYRLQPGGADFDLGVDARR